MIRGYGLQGCLVELQCNCRSAVLSLWWKKYKRTFWIICCSKAELKYLYSLEIFVKRQVNQITRHKNVTHVHAAITELKWRYTCDCGIEQPVGQWHLTEFAQIIIRTSQTKPAIWYLIQLMMVYAHFMLPCLSQASQCFCPRALRD